YSNWNNRVTACVAEQSGAGAPETSVRCGAPATLPPAGERREAIALALAEKWPGDYMQGDDECEREPNELAYETADLILASGLVQDEAGQKVALLLRMIDAAGGEIDATENVHSLL